MAINQYKKEIIREFNLENISEGSALMLNERIASYDFNPNNVIDWEILKAELLKDEYVA